MNMHVSGHSPSGGPHTSPHSPEMPEVPSPGHKPPGSPGLDGAGNTPDPGAAASAISNSGSLDTQLQNFIVQVGQKILKNGQDGWARAKEDDDDS